MSKAENRVAAPSAATDSDDVLGEILTDDKHNTPKNSEASRQMASVIKEMPEADNVIWTETGVARYLKVSVNTVQKWRKEGRGPAYSKAETCGQRRKDIDDYLERNKVTNESIIKVLKGPPITPAPASEKPPVQRVTKAELSAMRELALRAMFASDPPTELYEIIDD